VGGFAGKSLHTTLYLKILGLVRICRLIPKKQALQINNTFKSFTRVLGTPLQSLSSFQTAVRVSTSIIFLSPIIPRENGANIINSYKNKDLHHGALMPYWR